MSDHLPITPDQITAESIAAAEAGASIIHIHARDPETGMPTPREDVFREFLPRIRQATDAVVNVTTGGGQNMSVEDRTRAPLSLTPEMSSLNMGSMNFGIFPLVDRYTAWKHDWEEPYLRGTEDFVFRNTFRDIAYFLQKLGKEKGTRFEHECYDVGHLNNVAHFVDRGLLKSPFFVQMIFGILGGVCANLRNLSFMKETADRLFGEQHHWSVLAARSGWVCLNRFRAFCKWISAADFQGPWKLMTSVLNRPMMLSASALSHESPTLPTEGSMPASVSRSVYQIDRYWLPRSEWWTSSSASAGMR